ncbi:esterase E4-like [Anticarsia gemmatalis]|uniref:esterase E4-like n=1 Tax=Anticarsia gemmatalis TaxID=129554 RepID=UPI003F764884
MYREIYVFFLLHLWVGADKIVVTVKQGKISGLREETLFENRLYFAFYGVPYGSPPVGKLRFKDPKPVKHWSGTYDATTEYHGTCAQTHIVYKTGVYGVEDCLYMNIYTPHIPRTGDAILKTVIVWIHGYAFSSCFSHIHGPDFFINNDVVLVTVAHRIGVFGFMKINDNDPDANMGLKDIVLALKWIKTNIKQFGGDKNKITLMGSGSAATFITLLMTTKANKLFSSVILLSGALFAPSIFQGNPEAEKKRLVHELKRKHVTLNQATTKDIIEATHSIYIRNTQEIVELQRPIVPFTPTIEPKSNTSLLVRTPKEFFDTIKNKQIYSSKPILVGITTQESIPEVIPFIHNPYYLKKFINSFKYYVPFADGCSYNSSSETYKKISKLIKDRYFSEGGPITLLEKLLKYASDLIKFPIVQFVKTHLSYSKSKMFMYKFDYRGKLNAVKATSLAQKKVHVSGVASGDEICYLLRCEPLRELYIQINKEGVSKDRQFITELSTLWSNFAKFGDPTPPHSDINITWPPVDANLDNVLLIRKYFKLVSSKDERVMFDFWDRIYENYYKQEVCDKKHDEL